MDADSKIISHAKQRENSIPSTVLKAVELLDRLEPSASLEKFMETERLLFLAMETAGHKRARWSPNPSRSQEDDPGAAEGTRAGVESEDEASKAILQKAWDRLYERYYPELATFHQALLAGGRASIFSTHLSLDIEALELLRCCAAHTVLRSQEAARYALDGAEFIITLGLPEDGVLAQPDALRAPGGFFCLWEPGEETPSSIHLMLVTAPVCARMQEAVAFLVGGSAAGLHSFPGEDEMLATVAEMMTLPPVCLTLLVDLSQQKNGERARAKLISHFAAAWLATERYWSETAGRHGVVR
jgi:hypothetical protein